jgi:hypothetical protein
VEGGDVAFQDFEVQTQEFKEGIIKYKIFNENSAFEKVDLNVVLFNVLEIGRKVFVQEK